MIKLTAPLVTLQPETTAILEVVDPEVFVNLRPLWQAKEQLYPSQWAPYPPGELQTGGDGPPRVQGIQSYLVERMGEEAYEKYYKLQEIKLRTPRVDWRFWTGLGCACVAAGYLAFRS